MDRGKASADRRESYIRKLVVTGRYKMLQRIYIWVQFDTTCVQVVRGDERWYAMRGAAMQSDNHMREKHGTQIEQINEPAWMGK